jgi:hypothetical protein
VLSVISAKGEEEVYFEHTVTSKGLIVVRLEGVKNKIARDCVMRLHRNKARALVHKPRPSADAVRFRVRKSSEVDIDTVRSEMVELITQAILYAHAPASASEWTRKRRKKSSSHSYNNNRRARRKVIVPSR